MKTNLLTSFTALGIIMVLMTGCSFYKDKEETQVWQNDLRSEVQALGYRNWIVIADASFPFHNRQGVRTVVAPVETPAVVSSLLETIDEKQHVKPQFYVARELKSVSNNSAPGISQFRNELKNALAGNEPREVDEATLKRLLDGTSSSYAVLVVKTQTALPYSSVFIELDSGYWDGEAERELREKMKPKDGSSGSMGQDREDETVASVD